MIDLNEQIKQSEFGSIIGISQPAVSDLVSRGVLKSGASAGSWLLAYCGHLREVAAGRASMAGGTLDLVQERAALAREQREGQAIKNAIARGEYAPIELMAKVLSDACGAVVEKFDALPSRLRKEVPGLPQEAIEAVVAIVISARNEWVRAANASMLSPLPDVDEPDDDSERETIGT